MRSFEVRRLLFRVSLSKRRDLDEVFSLDLAYLPFRYYFEGALNPLIRVFCFRNLRTELMVSENYRSMIEENIRPEFQEAICDFELFFQVSLREKRRLVGVVQD